MNIPDRLRRIQTTAPAAMGEDGQLIAEAVRRSLSGEARSMEQVWGLADGWFEGDKRRRRDIAIIAFCNTHYPEHSAKAQAEGFEQELADFTARVWPHHAHWEAAPAHLTPRQQALFAILKIGAPVLSDRSIRRLVGQKSPRDGQLCAA